jgi:TolA-binding protein
MRSAWRVVLVFFAVSCLGFGQRKEYLELQREVAMLEDQVRTMQKAIDEKLSQLVQQGQQQSEATSKTNASVGALDKRFAEQEKSVAVPMANMGLKVDQMASDFQTLRESVATLNARFGKLEQQLLDISTALKTLQAPPAPPSAANPAPGLSAEALFQNAVRDKDGGSLDLALKGFTDYLQTYASTFQAPAAQYYIGEIHYQRGQFEDAVSAFDLVLEKFPENDMTPDAHYMKGMALMKLKETAKARGEFNTLIKRFPNNDLSLKARSQLRALTPAPAATKASKSKSR